MDTSIEQVIAAHTKTVYGVALTHSASRADADDIFQEVFAAYWRSKPEISDEEHLKAWLIRTTLNFCLKTTQSSWTKKTVYLDGNQKNPENALESTQVSAANSPEADAIEAPGADFSFFSEQQTQLYEAIRSLRVAYRTVVQLFYFEDLSIAQIADMLEEEQGAIKTRLSRARAQLREKLKEGNRDEQIQPNAQ